LKKAVLVFLLVLVSMFVFAQKVTLQIEGSAVPYYIPIYMGIELGLF